ncbi:MAG: S8 family serine peptidase [Candidatus Thorarchaeota archaeon]
MTKKYFLLLTLVASMLIVPSITTTHAVSLTPVRNQNLLIGSHLKMEISSQLFHEPVPALLQFDTELSRPQLEFAESLGVRFVRRGSEVVHVGRIYSAQVTDVRSLEILSNLGLLRASSGSKQFVPSLSTSVPVIGADDVWTNLKKDGNNINGTGVTVAVIDTGATWIHPSFWRPFPAEFAILSSGPDYYLDLNSNGFVDANEGPIRTQGGQTGSSIAYGSDYMYLDLDHSDSFTFSSGERWIGGVDANHDGYIQLDTESGVIMNISKIVKFYDQFSGNVFVRGVNLTSAPSAGDSDGHGTHVASTIAGGQPGFTSFVGVAPGADLIIVRSPLTSSTILDGISFAVENDADVINMSFSSYLGFLDGTDLEDLAINEAFLENGVLSVTAAGNLAGRQKHSRITAEGSVNGSATLSVNNPPDYSYLNLLWHSDDRDEHIVLYPPTGDPVDLGAFSAIAGHSFSVSTDPLSAYVFCDISIKGLNNIIVQVQTEEHYWDNGNWEVELYNPSGDEVTLDIFSWDGSWYGNSLLMTTDLDNGHSISSPGTADLTVTVAAYSESASGILSSSSRGPRIDGVPKPTVAAPGSTITAALNSVTSGSLWTSKSGTSMASPHVAGLLALIHQASGTGSPWAIYSALVEGAGGTTSHYDTPSVSWGHGLCNAVYSVMHVLRSPLSTGSMPTEWIGVPVLQTDTNDPNISDDLDILSLKAFEYGTRLGVMVETEGASDLSGADMLSIQWNTDSSGATGVNGIDLLVNVTGGNATVYEWTGSSYVVSSLTAVWWNQSTTTFVRIDGISQGTRGEISAVTSNSTVAVVDSTVPAAITDYLRPSCDDIQLDYLDGSMNVTIRISDPDSGESVLATGWSVIDGSLRILDSNVSLGSTELTAILGSDLVDTEYSNSLILNITSEGEFFVSPPVPLSMLIGARLQFTSGELYSDVVRVGFLVNDIISGQFSLDGYNLASAVYVGFHSEGAGYWLNFTLSSNDGIYDFEVSPSGFGAGEYGVYAIAIGRGVPDVEMQFATLTVVQDLTVLYIAVPAIAAVVAVYLWLKKRGGSPE